MKDVFMLGKSAALIWGLYHEHRVRMFHCVVRQKVPEVLDTAQAP